jgi:hypothetical protein
MKKPTVTQIKESGVLGEYFFSRDTLKFFGQTMASFTTAWYDRDASIVCVYAPTRESDGVKRGVTKRYIKVDGDKLRKVRAGEFHNGYLFNI